MSSVKSRLDLRPSDLPGAGEAYQVAHIPVADQSHERRSLSGRRLRALRVELGIPATAVAVAMRVSLGRVYAIERLRNVPRGLQLRYWTTLAQHNEGETSSSQRT